MFARSDLHVHTVLSGHSAGDLTVENVVRKCLQLRLKALGFAEHVTNAKELERPSLIEACLPADPPEGLDIYVGAEVDADPVRCDGSLVVPEKHLEGLDYVIGSIHHFPKSTLAWWKRSRDEDAQRVYEMWFEWTVRIVSNPSVDVLGHPAALLGHHKLVKDFGDERVLGDFGEIFRAARKNGVAIELNELVANKVGALADGYWRVIERAARSGVKISVGSDAHRLEDVGRLDWCRSVASMAGLTEESLFLPAKAKR
ncbi:MAG: PHP domain-containing protein [Thermoproteota archaeon]